MTPRDTLRQLLTVARQWQAAAFKAEPVEPDRAEKLAAEKRLSEILVQYFRHLKKRAIARLNADPPKQKAVSEWWDEDEFWEDDDFLTGLINLIVAATQAGALGLADMVGLSLDLTLTNKEAAAAAREYAYELVKGITETSREVLRDAVSAFVETPGMTIGDVIDALPFGEQRAALIATTEITRAYATGQAAAGAALKEQFPDVRVVKEWFTDNDDLVCAICGPLNGVEIEESELFGGEFDGPPAHPGCRCSVGYRTRING